MQQYPGRPTSPRSIRGRRTQPALPGASLPTAPLIVQSQPYNGVPQPFAKKQPQPARRAVLKLFGLGLLLEIFYLALYPLLGNIGGSNAAAKQALLGVFPWLPHLYWTTWFPAFASFLNAIPIFHQSANLVLLLLALAFVLVFIAARVGRRVLRERLSPGNIRLMFWVAIAITVLFGITFLITAGMISQDIFLYGIFGRVVTVYHANPYVANLTAFPDLLQAGLSKGTQGIAPYGPVWIDFSIPVTLFARESVANIIIGFRFIGLVAHLANSVLIWMILTKFKPETRLSGMLLYAWNPLVLLMSVSEMHYDVVVVLLILLAVFFFQRNSLTLSWVFLLLATLINVLCLLLLPLFLHLLWKETRPMKWQRRFLWWFSILGISALVVALAYAPYWQSAGGKGIAGILVTTGHAFVQNSAINSLDATIANLSIPFPSFVTWLVMPQHWTIFPAIAVGILLLFGLWLADTLELVVLFSSWLFLALLVLLPINWPQYVLLPLALALCVASYRTILLAILLTLGAALSYYFWLWRPIWVGQALLTGGLPLLLWGWTLFFTSTWQMTHPETEESEQSAKGSPSGMLRSLGFSRPSWPTRASWPTRRK